MQINKTPITTDFNELHDLSMIRSAIIKNNEAELAAKRAAKDIKTYIAKYAQTYVMEVHEADAYLSARDIKSYLLKYRSI